MATGSDEDEVNERTRLLHDPVCNAYQINSSNDAGNHYANSAPTRPDEQSALNRILQQTASVIIDVGALECHTLEQHEYIERVRAYNHKLLSLPINKSILMQRHSQMLLTDVPSAERVLSTAPISAANFKLITTATQKAATALCHIRVEHKEDLVVPFGLQ